MLLSALNLCKDYNQESGEAEVLKNLNLTVGQNEFVCITGRSGSGKSTLLNICAGILRPTSGEVFLNGEALYEKNDRELSFLRNDRIGYILQGYSVFPNMTVRENVQFPYYMYKRSGGIDGYTDYLMNKTGIAHLEKRRASKLSGGEARRVAIARALVNRPEVLLADEPTSDLDKVTTKEIMGLLKEIQKEGLTILMVTHDLCTLDYTDVNYEMEDGRLKPLK